MKQLFACALVALLYISSVESHTSLTGIRINGQDYNTCLRPQYPGSLYSRTNMGAQWPISSSDFLSNGLTSSNYTCGFLPFAANPAASKCTVAAGSTVGVSYYHGAGGGEDPTLDKYIARSHRGPFMAFMARSDTGAGDVWFKIFQEGKMQESSSWQGVKWASPDRMLATGGYMNFQIPSDIAPGNYLLRTEIIALHDTNYHGAQPYVHCIELTVTGGGTANPAGVSIPGNWDYNHPGITYNVYNNFQSPYPFPGPSVYTAGSGSGSGAVTTAPATTAKATTAPATTGTATTGPSSTSGSGVPAGGSVSFVYSDNLRNGWQDWSWGSSNNFYSSGAYDGSSCISSTLNAWGGLQFGRISPVPTSTFLGVSFWAKTSSGNYDNLRISVNDRNPIIVSGLTSTWKFFFIDMYRLGYPDSVSKLAFQNFQTGTTTLFFDNVQFIYNGAGDPFEGLPETNSTETTDGSDSDGETSNSLAAAVSLFSLVFGVTFALMF